MICTLAKAQVIGHDNGTAAPAETVRQRNAAIAAHKKADKRLKALVLLKSKGDLKTHAMAYKCESGKALIEHLGTMFAATSTTKTGQLIKKFLTEKLKSAKDITTYTT